MDENPAPLVHGPSSTGNKSFQHRVRFLTASDSLLEHLLVKKHYEVGIQKDSTGICERILTTMKTRDLQMEVYTKPNKPCFRNLYRKGTNINCSARVMSD